MQTGDKGFIQDLSGLIYGNSIKSNRTQYIKDIDQLLMLLYILQA